MRDYLRAGVEVDDQGVARSRFHFDNHMQVVDALWDQRPEALFPLVDRPVLLCVARDPDDGELTPDLLAAQEAGGSRQQCSGGVTHSSAWRHRSRET